MIKLNIGQRLIADKGTQPYNTCTYYEKQERNYEKTNSTITVNSACEFWANL